MISFAIAGTMARVSWLPTIPQPLTGADTIIRNTYKEITHTVRMSFHQRARCTAIRISIGLITPMSIHIITRPETRESKRHV